MNICNFRLSTKNVVVGSRRRAHLCLLRADADHRNCYFANWSTRAFGKKQNGYWLFHTQKAHGTISPAHRPVLLDGPGFFAHAHWIWYKWSSQSHEM